MQALTEQRIEKRLGESFPLVLDCGETGKLSGETVDISRRGLSCRVSRAVPPFSRVKIRFSLPATDGAGCDLRLNALVVRCEETAGRFLLGLLFLHLTRQKVDLLDDCLATLDARQLAADGSPGIGSASRPNEVCLTSRFDPQAFLQDYKLTRLDRLACLGELSSILAHEIKNPLACLAGSLQILGRDISELYPSEELFSELFGQIERIDTIVDHLLQFSTTESLNLKPLRIEEVITGTLRLLGSKLQEKEIDVTLCHGRQQPLVQADERLLRQAFLNIFANLVDGAVPGDRFSINTHWPGKVPLCQRSVCACFAREEGTGLSIVVMQSGPADGCGDVGRQKPLSLAERKKRGLNLSLTQQIIEQHQGSVYIQNHSEESSVLLVALPL